MDAWTCEECGGDIRTCGCWEEIAITEISEDDMNDIITALKEQFGDHMDIVFPKKRMH